MKPAVLALATLSLLLAACGERVKPEATQTPSAGVPAGDPERGRLLAAQYGCNVCHVVPGVSGPQGRLGPSLDGLASRPRFAMETAETNATNLARYIRNPGSVNPQTSMPPIAVNDAEAADIAAFLLTLR